MNYQNKYGIAKQMFGPVMNKTEEVLLISMENSSLPGWYIGNTKFLVHICDILSLLNAT